MHEILSQLKTLQDHVFRNQDNQNPGTSGNTPSSSRPPSSKEKCNNYSDFESDSEEELSHGNETDSSDDGFENYDKPHTSFGSMVDSMVSMKLRSIILDNRYVEMAELLPRFQTKLSDEFVMRPGKHNNAKLVKCRPKYDMSFKQWREGFDIYMPVYIDNATSVSGSQKLVKSMLTYRKAIANLESMDHDWQAYDRHFRIECETKPISWSTHLDQIYKCNTNGTTPVTSSFFLFFAQLSNQTLHTKQDTQNPRWKHNTLWTLHGVSK